MFRRTKAWVIMIRARGGKNCEVQPVINISAMRMLDFRCCEDSSSQIFSSENIEPFYFFQVSQPSLHLWCHPLTGFSVGFFSLEFYSNDGI